MDSDLISRNLDCVEKHIQVRSEAAEVFPVRVQGCGS